MRLAGHPKLKVTDRGLWFDGVHWADALAAVSTPCFLLFPDRVQQNCQGFIDAARKAMPGAKVYYSVKTNAVPAVLHEIVASGAGAQVVSIEELAAARQAGFAPGDIIMDGTHREPGAIDACLDTPGTIIVESWLENLVSLDRACKARGMVGRAGLRFSYPSRDKWLGFHGEDEVAMSTLVATLHQAANVHLVMLACHRGSQLHDAAAHVETCRYLLGVRDRLERDGLISGETMINLGGGFPEPGVAGQDYIDTLMVAIKDTITANHSLKDCNPCFEPGRFIVADAAVLVATIEHAFVDRTGLPWLMLDAGMDVLTRFSNSHLRAFSVEHAGEPHGTPVGLQGRLPTEQDVLAKGMHFASKHVPGEHVVLVNCGAYTTTFSMRFSYPYPRWHVIDKDVLHPA